jgi:hypothetical protein
MRVDVPGAPGTVAAGLCGSGMIAGNYQNPNVSSGSGPGNGLRLLLARGAES